MIRCKDGILQRLKENGFSTYRIDKEKLISRDQMQKIRHGEQVSIYTINRICQVLSCQPGDIIEYLPDEDDKAAKVKV